jgi:hypothetical protein
MKTAIYEPKTKALIKVQNANFHHSDTPRIAVGVVQEVMRSIGPVPGAAFCVFDRESLRVFPLNHRTPPTFEEVEKAAVLHGYVITP